MAAIDHDPATQASGKLGRVGAAPYVSLAERAARGKSLRSQTPRSSHAVWEPHADRRDPVSLLEEQAAQRVPELVPIRYERMSASPFAFYRGAAYVMAGDLGVTPATGIRVQLCGDAHLANFGGFASAERRLLFDVVDFDETLPGPWEWDLKRLAASVSVAGRENGLKAQRRIEIVRELVGEYRREIRRLASMNTLDVWYASVSISEIEELLRARGTPSQTKRFEKTVSKGRRKDSARAFAKLAVEGDGDAHIRADPPLIVPIADLADHAGARRLEVGARMLLESYLSSLSGERRRLLARYSYADLARKVVGVGSVGTRCWVVLLVGRDANDALFLQAKEAPRSVLERFAGRSEFSNQGQRVVEGQRLMQAASDIFLGWLREPPGIEDLKLRDLYLRQLWDSKISLDVTAMGPRDLTLYAKLCAAVLARAHARSGDSVAIGSYLGSSDAFDRAIAAFAEAYADQNERDHAALLGAIASGRIRARSDT
ncbi:MAG TPA: DUF2252 domain-containing protein [Solirubrobacteraceae bacterium]|nr:DUF2252 domain-containing protein [Solirubrobacteraceae bacterium]